MASPACDDAMFTKYLTGFNQALNWRPTEFVTALQRIRSCSLCGVVPNETQVLPCSHVLCKLCYESVNQPGQVCPVDKKAFSEMQVTRIEFPELLLLKREVRCWNKNHGCQFVGSLADALFHFHEQCSFHQVKCPKCSTMVPQRQMLDHYKQGCRKQLGQEQVGQQSYLMDDVLKSTKAIEEMLAMLADTQAALQDSLNNLTAETREGLRKVENSASGRTRELVEFRERHDQFDVRCSKTLQDIQESLKNLPGAIRHQDWLKKKFSSVLHADSDEIYWSVEDVSYHIKRAENSNAVQVASDPFLVSGYTARLRLKIVKDGDDFSVQVYFNLCRGPNDGELDWPFIIPLKLTLVPKKDRGKTSTRTIDPVSSNFPECFVRPTEEENTGEGGTIARSSTFDEFSVNDAILVFMKLIR